MLDTTLCDKFGSNHLIFSMPLMMVFPKKAIKKNPQKIIIK
jgi:hypothetical protein